MLNIFLIGARSDPDTTNFETFGSGCEGSIDMDLTGSGPLLCSSNILGDPEVAANIYCKLRNLPNTDTQNYSTDLR